MKAVILAGGFGTRLAEETQLRPKPMIEIGGRPLLWHIMKLYSFHGVTEFVICLGYKAEVIKEYFCNYYMHNSDLAVDLSDGSVTTLQTVVEPWKITLVDTGLNSMTGGRLRRARRHIGQETFCLTYGDGVADIDIAALIAHHRASGRSATVTAVQPPGRFGVLQFDDASDHVTAFTEKPRDEIGWINGGFFVLEPSVIDLVDDDSTVWEDTPMRTLAGTGQLSAFRHTGFWQACDTLRDKMQLEALWSTGRAPWRVW
ncbi:glucose-1-phosphate cytidylyltransferase [Ancylobacter pratisalsi]|uniref:Glucose-1-phosphate cytidylyltransferase n=1 Tax=Ancylobacter pratisalsi TaxID=1745854 RepID=A0A6P1YJ56_9HYPH|nr:glucose-1-phosphate cytidylyltransferase [Ancylobacter pratisalsi]QIB32701.1 glucose-1-phosphate cytidylyltransferase [Ancylobacter pratisalsi]